MDKAEVIEYDDPSYSIDYVTRAVTWSDLRRWSENKSIPMPRTDLRPEQAFALGATVEIEQRAFVGLDISEMRTHLKTMTNGKWSIEAIYERKEYMFRVDTALVRTNIHFESPEDAAIFKCVWC